METDLKEFTKLFNQLAHRHSYLEVFNDFLDMVIYALANQQYEEEYKQLISKYSKEEQEKFAHLFAEMVILMDGDGRGYVDALGEYFMIHITRGHNGQFFTPTSVTDFMALIVGDEPPVRNKTICDPACGSGRMLLSFAKSNTKDNWFFAADLDHTCVKMCVINLCLNGMKGQVAHMNSLSLDMYCVYEIYLDAKRFYIPTIRKINIEDSVFHTNKEAFLKAHFEKQETIKQTGSKATNNNQIVLDLFSQPELEAL
jgi:type I restriction-modification system DNA methylase subunit